MSSILKKSMKKFLLMASASLILSLGSGTVYACIDYIGLLGGEAPAFVSCGSSAGNYAYWCEPSTNQCIIDNDPETQADVDAYCASSESCLNRPKIVENAN